MFRKLSRFHLFGIGLRSNVVVTSALAKTTKTRLEALLKFIESHRLILTKSEYFMENSFGIIAYLWLLKMTSVQNCCRSYVVDTLNWQFEKLNIVCAQTEQC